MDKQKRKRTQKTLRYFFLNNKIHKVIRSSRSKDEIVAWCYPDKKRVLYSYIDVQKNMENAYNIKQVASMLNKHKITIEDYILEGKVRKPQKIYPIGNPESKWSKFMFHEIDILDIHDHILNSGHSKNIPSKNELKALLKNNIMLYTKTGEGNFVPVWKAE